MIHRTGTRAWCVRTESDKPRETGWVHDLDDDRRGDTITAVPHRQVMGIDVTRIAKLYQNALGVDPLCRLATSIGVEAVSLDLLNIGWSAADAAFSFPMRDHAGNIVGIRLRNDDGEKWSVRGGKEGLFYSPLRLGVDTRYVCEGPTDTAAMLDLGVSAIGRPSCTGGTDHLLKMLHGNHNIVIVADHDGPGLAGARSFANRCVGVCRSVRIIRPIKGKDAREWKHHGLTADILRRVVENSPIWTRNQPTAGNSSPLASTSEPTSAAATVSIGSPSEPA